MLSYLTRKDGLCLLIGLSLEKYGVFGKSSR